MTGAGQGEEFKESEHNGKAAPRTRARPVRGQKAGRRNEAKDSECVFHNAILHLNELLKPGVPLIMAV